MRKLSLAFVALLILPPSLAAQAGFYPAFQPTRVAEREYNFGLVDWDGGTGLLFQWREGLNSRSQFTADVGLSDGDGPADGDGAIILGGSFHYQLMRANSELPFDMVFGAGLGLTAGDDYNVFRIPVGVAIGHRFPLEGKYAITPYVHPRFSIDRVSAGPANDTDTNIDIDIGGMFELNERMQIRMAATLGNGDAVGVSFVWLPRGLR